MAKLRAHFFSCKEQEFLIKGYDEEREVLTSKSNTARAAKLREDAWQRIADKLNVTCDSGNKRTWQQVKVKYKNLFQTAKRRAEVRKTEGGLAPRASTPAEEFQHNAKRPLVEEIPGGASSDPVAGCSCSYISVTGNYLTLLPPPESDPASADHSICETLFFNDTHFDEDLDLSSSRERASSAGAASGGSSGEEATEVRKVLYRRYLKKEIDNRDQEMAYRALKMRKLEKEILLLDKQLDKR
ncbi:hypothetical protein SKAU_G00289860 [Synaphobranchus kaupii]|uniref:Myb/SANT-like DNA-binding domain-containing protein n=1 Tax=Synaphobranchus kaupii TaxID=118154 RepID=A0A9Q1ETL5_SYNKA|nr:hypothetical protein SKAU_G00289860 [Synaphobranchus kaupii]